MPFTWSCTRHSSLGGTERVCAIDELGNPRVFNHADKNASVTALRDCHQASFWSKAALRRLGRSRDLHVALCVLVALRRHGKGIVAPVVTPQDAAFAVRNLPSVHNDL